MGAKASVTQKIYTKMESKVSAVASASATASCRVKNVKINYRDSAVRCPTTIKNECSANAEAEIEAIIEAVQEAVNELSQKQQAAFTVAFTDSDTNQDITTIMRTFLETGCDSLASADAIVDGFEINVGRCEDSPVVIRNLASAKSLCLAKAVIDAAQKVDGDLEANQETTGIVTEAAEGTKGIIGGVFEGFQGLQGMFIIIIIAGAIIGGIFLFTQKDSIGKRVEGGGMPNVNVSSGSSGGGGFSR